MFIIIIIIIISVLLKSYMYSVSLFTTSVRVPLYSTPHIYVYIRAWPYKRYMYSLYSILLKYMVVFMYTLYAIICQQLVLVVSSYTDQSESYSHQNYDGWSYGWSVIYTLYYSYSPYYTHHYSYDYYNWQ